jgi:hypothetical protein
MESHPVGTAERPHKLQAAKQIVCRYVFYEQREADIMLEAPNDQEARRRGKYLTVHARQLALQPVQNMELFFRCLAPSTPKWEVLRRSCR